MTRKSRTAYSKAYGEANKEKIAARQKAYRKANKEKFKARYKAYYEANKEKLKACREANKEKKNTYAKAYREDNKEKIATYLKAYGEANKEKKADYDKTYREANPEKMNEMSARRRALKVKAIPEHLRDCPFERERINQIYKLRNLITKITGIEHHVDHMWPLSKRGPHWSGNLQVIPASENMSKAAKLCRETKGVIEKALSNFVSERSI